MKRLLCILLILLLPVLAISAQSEDSLSDYEKLMNGEIIELVWDEHITFNGDFSLDNDFPEPYQLIKEFVMNNTDSEDNQMYIFLELIHILSPEMHFEKMRLFGLNATQLQWNENALYATTELNSLPSTFIYEDEERNSNFCTGGDENMFYTFCDDLTPITSSYYGDVDWSVVYLKNE